MDCNSPGSSVHGISQIRILEWIATPSPGDLPDPGIEPGSPELEGAPILSQFGEKNSEMFSFCFMKIIWISEIYKLSIKDLVAIDDLLLFIYLI